MKQRKNFYYSWKYLFLALATFYGLSIVEMWFTGLEAGLSFSLSATNPLTRVMGMQVIVVGIYLMGVLLSNKETQHK